MSGTTNKRIVFSATDNGVESLMSRIQRSAQDLSQGMIREASESSKSQQDVIKYFEQQISLIEKRNKIDSEGRKLDARDRLDRQMANPDLTASERKELTGKYKDEIGQISKDSKTYDMQIRILREIADTMKIDSRKATESDVRDNDEESPVARREESSRKRGGRKKRRSQRQPMDVAGYIMGVQQMFGASSGSQALMGAGGAMMSYDGAIGRTGKLAQIVGMVGEVLNMSNDAAANIHKSYSRAISLGGGSTDLMKKNRVGDDAYEWGFTRDEYFNQFLAPTMQSRGSITSSIDYSKDAMTLHRGTGLDINTIMALEKAQARTMKEGTGINSMDMVARMIDAHQGTGAFGKGGVTDFSRLQDAMTEFIGMQQTILMRSGHMTGMGSSLHMSRALERMGGVYKDDQYKWSTIQAIDRGITTQASPESTAIKMNILRKAMPDASYAEMQEEMEKGLESKHLMKGMLEFTAGTGGDENSRAILMQQLMGNQMRWSDINRMVTNDGIQGMYSGLSYADSMYGSSWSVEEDIKGRSGSAVSKEMRSQIERQQRLDDAKADPFGSGGKEYADYLITGFGNKIDELGQAISSWFD